MSAYVAVYSSCDSVTSMRDRLGYGLVVTRLTLMSTSCTYVVNRSE